MIIIAKLILTFEGSFAARWVNSPPKFPGSAANEINYDFHLTQGGTMPVKMG